MELLHRLVQQCEDHAVHIHILQPDQSLPDDSAVMGDEHPRSEDGVGEYGVFGESVADHSSGTTAARRAQDVQSRTRRFKVRQSDRVDLMCEMWLPEPEISSSRANLMSYSYQKSEVLCKHC